MKKVKNFKEFLSEKMMDEVQNLEDTQISAQFEDDEMVDEFDDEMVDEFDDEMVDEFDDENTDHEPEELEDILELKYNTRTRQWVNIGELDLPSDFDVFYEWFIEVDEENTTASMKEEGDEVVFYLPEDLYIEYMEDIEKGVQFEDDVDLDDEIQIDEDEFDEDEF